MLITSILETRLSNTLVCRVSSGAMIDTAHWAAQCHCPAVVNTGHGMAWQSLPRYDTELYRMENQEQGTASATIQAGWQVPNQSSQY